MLYDEAGSLDYVRFGRVSVIEVKIDPKKKGIIQELRKHYAFIRNATESLSSLFPPMCWTALF